MAHNFTSAALHDLHNRGQLIKAYHTSRPGIGLEAL